MPLALRRRGDEFGFSVGISGDTVVVGAISDDSSTTGVNSVPDESANQSGAAYVFTRSGVVWTQQAYLRPAAVGTTQAGDAFGWSVAVSGDTIVVGAPGEDSSTTGVNSMPDEGASGAGAAYVFGRSGTAWTQQAYLKPDAIGTSQAGDRFGSSVAISGATLIVGAYLEDSSSTGVNSVPDENASAAGAAYIFTRNGATWTPQAYLKPNAVGITQAGDQFGVAVAISGDVAVIGANFEDSNSIGVIDTPNESAADSGAAYIFLRNGSTWSQQADLKPVNVGSTQAGDQFGLAVAVSNGTVVVGAIFEDGGGTGVNSLPDESAYAAGAGYIFTGLDPPLDADNDGLLDSWELTNWPTTNGHNPLDDSDHDGYCELLELAFGMNPTLPDASGLPTPVNESGYLTMTITKQAGVTYEVQSTGSLLAAQPDSFSAATTTVITNNATTLKVRDNFLIGTSPPRFMRVKVTAAP